MPKVKVNDIELYYEVHGQGYPLVFLHGFSSAVSTWEPQVPVFSKEYQFITYDARGHGQSDSPPWEDQYSADIVVEDLFQLLGALGIEKAVVGGLSMGGYQTLRFYLRHPEMVTALIIMDTGPGYRNPARREEWNRQYEERVRLLETEGVEAAAAYSPNSKGVIRSRNPVGVVHMARTVVMQHDSLVIENLPEIKVPALVLVGEKDMPYLRAAEYMTEFIPGAEHVVIPGAGHVSNLDNEQFFNRTVLDFLKKLNLPEV